MTTTALTIAFGVLAALVIALTIAIEMLWREQRRMRFDSPAARAVAAALRDGRSEDAIGELLGYLEAVHQRMESLAEHARGIDEALEGFRDRSRSHLQRIGVVRFDASESVSGRLSCALCVLDAHSNGFLVTTLYDLERSRTFVRAVRGGGTDRELLDEEAQALHMALAGGVADTDRRPRETEEPAAEAEPEPEEAGQPEDTLDA